MPLDDAKNTLWDLDTDTVDPRLGEEMLRQAELRQAAIFQAALGMDQRAAVLAAGFIAASGALAAAGIAIGPGHLPIRVAAGVAALVVALAAGSCVLACRPQKFRFPGIMPLRWGGDAAYLAEGLHAIRMARVAELQDDMVRNERQQATNGRWLTAGLALAAATPFLASAAWVVLRSLLAR